MGDGGPNGLQHLREQRSSSQQMVPLGQRISYLINAFRTDDSLDTEPEHGEDNEADDTEIAKPESEWRATDNRNGHAEPCTDGASQHYDNRNGKMPKGNS